MIFTLTELKIYEGLSEETLAYSATLCIDGQPAFHCANRGTGGPDEIRRVGSISEEGLSAHLRNDPPYGLKLHEYSSPIEDLVALLIARDDAAKLLRTVLNTAFVYIKDGAVLSLTPQSPTRFSQEWLQRTAERYPNRRQVTLQRNFEEAVAILSTQKQDT